MRGLRGYGAFSALQIHGLLHTQRIALADDVSAWDITIEVERRKETEGLAGMTSCGRLSFVQSRAGRTAGNHGPEPRKTAKLHLSESSRRPEGLAVLVGGKIV